jgi:hypothetical protein
MWLGFESTSLDRAWKGKLGATVRIRDTGWVCIFSADASGFWVFVGSTLNRLLLRKRKNINQSWSLREIWRPKHSRRSSKLGNSSCFSIEADFSDTLRLNIVVALSSSLLYCQLKEWVTTAVAVRNVAVLGLWIAPDVCLFGWERLQGLLCI